MYPEPQNFCPGRRGSHGKKVLRAGGCHVLSSHRSSRRGAADRQAPVPAMTPSARHLFPQEEEAESAASRRRGFARGGWLFKSF